jgi:glucose-1-phosphate adenylyltransferase
VRVDERSVVESSVILNRVEIGRDCRVRHAIIDEGCQIPDGMSVGIDREADSKRFYVTANGVTLVTSDMLRELAST